MKNSLRPCDPYAALERTEVKLIEMTNGCICRVLREVLRAVAAVLARDGRFDDLLIESTGVSESAPVAETCTFTLSNVKASVRLTRLTRRRTIDSGLLQRHAPR